MCIVQNDLLYQTQFILDKNSFLTLIFVGMSLCIVPISWKQSKVRTNLTILAAVKLYKKLSQKLKSWNSWFQQNVSKLLTKVVEKMSDQYYKYFYGVIFWSALLPKSNILQFRLTRKHWTIVTIFLKLKCTNFLNFKI